MPLHKICPASTRLLHTTRHLTRLASRLRVPRLSTLIYRAQSTSTTTKLFGKPIYGRPLTMDELNSKLAALGIEEPLPVFEKSYPDKNSFDIFRSYIAHELAKISGVDEKLIYPGLEWTQSPDKGDLVLAVPRLRIKGAKPQDLAVEWAEKFPENKYIEKPRPNGTFMQFFFKTNLLNNLVLASILSQKASYGFNPIDKGKKVIVEFSSPNIAKPFHAGHLRSTIIGGFLSNLYEIFGWEVIRMNYLGDWGKQFGILAVGFKRFGSEEELKKDPIHHLFNVYVKINQVITEEKGPKAAEGEPPVEPKPSPTDDEAREFFVKMENGDEECLKLWQKFRDLSIEKYIDTYRRLNITYDVYSGESQVKKESMEKATQILKEKGLSEESQGAIIVDLTRWDKKLGKAIVQKRDGTTLYLTRDIGAAMERYEQYKFDKMIYVVASQQDLHLAQLFRILKEMGFDWASKCQHINFGMVLGMSTRAGNVVFLDDILAAAEERMHEVMKGNADKYAQLEDPHGTAEIIGRSGVMIQDMSGKRINNYPFNMDRMTSFEGDTGPYLQYAHSRVCSILRKANIPAEAYTNADFTLLTEKHATDLVRVLAQYPDVLMNTMKTQEPTTIVNYLFKMTHLLSSGYDVLRVVGEKDEGVRNARMALYESARIVLNNGMRLLGLTPVERM